MVTIIDSIAGELTRYRALAEAAFAQLSNEERNEPLQAGSLSISQIAWHLGGNLASRFTDFLDSDGEKEWRDRDGEFSERRPSQDELLAQWRRGWSALESTLETLTDEDLGRTITIRQQPLSVNAALHRCLGHVSYHVGQIVFVAKAHRGSAWASLSIPPGGSRQYSANPTSELPSGHADRLRES